MPDTAVIALNLSRIVFLITRIALLYVFLTPKRSFRFQVIAFAATWATSFLLRTLLKPFALDPILLGYLMGTLDLIPCALIFRETLRAKIFVFFMTFTLSQFVFFISMSFDRFVFPSMPHTLLLLGVVLGLASLPLVSRYLRPPVSGVIESISQQDPSFALFPILSFTLLVFHGVRRTDVLANFIPSVLANMLSLFSYYLIAISIDRTRRQQLLDLTSRTDSLTGLYNRRHMEQRIQEEYDRYRRTGSQFALVIADVDLFKEINDRHGHDCGDCLLKSISEDLQKSTREYDTVARWGGEEFLLLLPATEAEDAVALAKRIVKIVGEHRYAYDNESLSVTLTLGVSVIRRDDTITSIIKKADAALYRGKRAGRNCAISFEDTADMEIPVTS